MGRVVDIFRETHFRFECLIICLIWFDKHAEKLAQCIYEISPHSLNAWQFVFRCCCAEQSAIMQILQQNRDSILDFLNFQFAPLHVSMRLNSKTNFPLPLTTDMSRSTPYVSLCKQLSWFFFRVPVFCLEQIRFGFITTIFRSMELRRFLWSDLDSRWWCRQTVLEWCLSLGFRIRYYQG